MKLAYDLGRFAASSTGKTVGVIAVLGVLAFNFFPRSTNSPANLTEMDAPRSQAVIAAPVVNEKEQACTAGRDARNAAVIKAKSPVQVIELLRTCEPFLIDSERETLKAARVKEFDRQAKATQIAVAAEDKKQQANRGKQGVSIGMTMDEVLVSSWGKPSHVNKDITARHVREQWVYGSRNYLYFDDGILKTIQTGN